MAAELSNIRQRVKGNWLELERQVFSEMEVWLDRAERADRLQVHAVAKMVMDAVEFRNHRIWNLFEYVIMPSHLHLFFELVQPGLKKHLEQFKRWTGHEAAKLLHLDGDRFWQDEWFDHWSRSDEQDERIIEYIRRNPEKTMLVRNHLDWPYGGWRARR